MRTERGDDAYYVVISFDRPYDTHVNAAGDVLVPFATRSSADRAAARIMVTVRESHPVVAGEVIAGVPPITAPPGGAG